MVVMLTQLEEKGKEQCAQYWPQSEDSPEKVGNYTIELISEGLFEDYLIRELKVTDVPVSNYSWSYLWAQLIKVLCGTVEPLIKPCGHPSVK